VPRGADFEEFNVSDWADISAWIRDHGFPQQQIPTGPLTAAWFELVKKDRSLDAIFFPRLDLQHFITKPTLPSQVADNDRKVTNLSDLGYKEMEVVRKYDQLGKFSRALLLSGFNIDPRDYRPDEQKFLGSAYAVYIFSPSVLQVSQSESQSFNRMRQVLLANYTGSPLFPDSEL
jgi:hypothetical protein